jgi:uncharacterized membrane protein
MEGKDWMIIGAAGVGAGVMYLLDPEAGRRRRHRAIDGCVSLTHRSQTFFGRASRDIGHRLKGAAAEARHAFTRDDASGARLAARIRARIGRVVSHPHAIDVSVEDGRVILSGPILEREVDELVSAVSGIRGVGVVENRLEPHETGLGIPALQGGSPRVERGELMQENWTPAIRVGAMLAGAGMAAYGIARKDALGAALGTIGVGFLARGLSNRPMTKLVGIRRGPALVDVVKTIEVQAPVESVFQLWSRPENFPRFMSGVRDVKATGEGRSRWIVDGPAGSEVHWEAETTRFEPNRRISWKTLPGAVVKNAGTVHFQPNDTGGTRVQVHLTYDPPAGALGHLAAVLFGADPKSRLDEDLLRMKTFVETGQAPHDAAAQEAPRQGIH